MNTNCSPEFGLDVIRALRDKDIQTLCKLLEEYCVLNDIELPEEYLQKIATSQNLRLLN